MNKKEIIILAAIGAGVYILSQVKAMKTYIAPQYAKTAAQKAAQKRIGQPITRAAYIAALRKAATLRKQAAQKIGKKIGKTAAQKAAQKAAAQKKIRQEAAQKIAQRIAQKVAPKRIGQPTTRAAHIAALRKAAARKAAVRKAAAQKIGKKIGKTVAQKIAQKMDISKLPVQRLRYMIAHAQTQNIPREELAALKAEVARRAAAWKAAVRKAAAQKIGKKIGKTVAQKIPLNVKTRRAVIAQYAKRQRPQIQRPNTNKKWAGSKLFPGAEKSGIIPYSESSKHSYYGPKNHKLQNEGYMVEWQKRHYNSLEAYNDRKLQYVLSHPEYWKK